LTQDGTAPDLLALCIGLIDKGETLEYLDSALVEVKCELFAT